MVATLEPELKGMSDYISGVTRAYEASRALREFLEVAGQAKAFAMSLRPALFLAVEQGPAWADRVMWAWVDFCRRVVRQELRPDERSQDYWYSALGNTAQTVLLLEMAARESGDTAAGDALGRRLSILQLMLEDLDSPGPRGLTAVAERWHGYNVDPGEPIEALRRAVADAASPAARERLIAEIESLERAADAAPPAPPYDDLPKLDIAALRRHIRKHPFTPTEAQRAEDWSDHAEAPKG